MFPNSRITLESKFYRGDDSLRAIVFMYVSSRLLLDTGMHAYLPVSFANFGLAVALALLPPHSPHRSYPFSLLVRLLAAISLGANRSKCTQVNLRGLGKRFEWEEEFVHRARGQHKLQLPDQRPMPATPRRWPGSNQVKTKFSTVQWCKWRCERMRGVEKETSSSYK